MSTLPTFSVVIETANLSLADLEGLQDTLASLSHQTVPLYSASEVLIADSGDVPADVLRVALERYPWARVMRLPQGTGYEELKMAGAAATTGDIVVFADGDCLYEPQWLEALLSLFSDSSVAIVGGETAIDASGPYGLGVALAASFPARTSGGPYKSDRYHLNNVAFRRTVLNAVPIPSRLPCYRMSGLHAARLAHAGYRILRQPSARAQHAAPNGGSHFFWRFLLMGYDGVVVPQLIARESPASTRGRMQRRRTFALMRFWARQAVAKLVGEIRRDPSRLLSLPLAVPVFAGAVFLQAAGAIGGLLAPGRLLAAVPAELLRGSTCQPGPITALPR
jgi:glycosyltransferase involved in cell wall biosynthesis